MKRNDKAIHIIIKKTAESTDYLGLDMTDN